MRVADHGWQEYNAHGNSCHHPGCRLGEDEHPARVVVLRHVDGSVCAGAACSVASCGECGRHGGHWSGCLRDVQPEPGRADCRAQRLVSYQPGDVVYSRSDQGHLLVWRVAADGGMQPHPARPAAGVRDAWPGFFVVLAGGEGSGKSTQAGRLVEALGPDRAFATREPGGTTAGGVIRELVIGDTDLCDRAEALLYAADRAQHVARKVLPLLARGWVVVSDRHAESSVAYQGAARGLGQARIRELSLWATGGVEPDLTVLLDIKPEVGLERARARGVADRFEALGVDFHERVRLSLLEQAQSPSWALVSADGSEDEVAGLVLAEVRRRMARRAVLV